MGLPSKQNELMNIFYIMVRKLTSQVWVFFFTCEFQVSILKKIKLVEIN